MAIDLIRAAYFYGYCIFICPCILTKIRHRTLTMCNCNCKFLQLFDYEIDRLEKYEPNFQHSQP